LKKELEIHDSVLTPIYEIKSEIDSLHALGINILFISDMYLPKDFITHILIRHGFYIEGDSIYVSCDIGLSKYSGHLYDYIKEKHNINWSQWYHKGDNVISDIRIPQKKGIHTDKISFPYSYYEKKIVENDCSCSNLTIIKAAACARATRLSFPDTPEIKFASNFIAPTYVPFVYSILKDAEERGIQNLFFIARDGYILFRIAEIFRKSFPNIKLNYLYASRKSLYLPGMCDTSLNSILEVLPANCTEVIDDLLSYLHLSNLNINTDEFVELDKETM